MAGALGWKKGAINELGREGGGEEGRNGERGGGGRVGESELGTDGISRTQGRGGRVRRGREGGEKEEFLEHNLGVLNRTLKALYDQYA